MKVWDCDGEAKTRNKWFFNSLTIKQVFCLLRGVSWKQWYWSPRFTQNFVSNPECYWGYCPSHSITLIHPPITMTKNKPVSHRGFPAMEAICSNSLLQNDTIQPRQMKNYNLQVAVFPLPVTSLPLQKGLKKNTIFLLSSFPPHIPVSHSPLPHITPHVAILPWQRPNAVISHTASLSHTSSFSVCLVHGFCQSSTPRGRVRKNRRPESISDLHTPETWGTQMQRWGCVSVLGEWQPPLMRLSAKRGPTGSQPATHTSIAGLLSPSQLSHYCTVCRLPYAESKTPYHLKCAEYPFAAPPHPK